MDFYDRLNELLRKRHVSKRALCTAMGINYTTLANMIQRKSNSINLEIVKKIADYFDTTVEYLATGNEKYKYKNIDANNTITITTESETTTYKVSPDEIKAIKTLLHKIGD